MEGQKGGRMFLVKTEGADLRGLKALAALSHKKKTLEQMYSI
jgi:hypothetical protein